MKELPNPFWAVLLIICAAILAVLALRSTNANAASVITMASSIVTGAFGYIQGVRDGAKSVMPPDMPPGSSATQTSTVQAGPVVAGPK